MILRNFLKVSQQVFIVEGLLKIIVKPISQIIFKGAAHKLRGARGEVLKYITIGITISVTKWKGELKTQISELSNLWTVKKF